MPRSPLERIERLLPGFTARYGEVPLGERPVWLLKELAAALEFLDERDRALDALENQLLEESEMVE